MKWNKLIFKTYLVLASLILPQIGGVSFAQLHAQLLPSVKFEQAPATATDSPKHAAAKSDAPTSPNSIRLGYCSDYYSGDLYPQDGSGEFEFGGMVKLTKEVLSKYAESNIDSISFRTKTNSDICKSVTVFISATPDSNNPLVRSTAYKLNTNGWTTVKLPRPQYISGKVDLYVGYLMLIEDNVPGQVGVAFDSRYNVYYGCNYYGVTTNEGGIGWYSADPIHYNVCVRAYASGGHIPGADAGIFGLEMSDLISLDRPSELGFNLRNFSAEPIKSVDVSVHENGNEFITRTISGLDIPSNCESHIALDNILFDEDCNKHIKVDVTKVNGIDDEDINDNTLEKEIFVINPEAELQERQVLVEQFTAENYSSTALADSIYHSILDRTDEAIVVKHHITFKNIKDQFMLPGDEAMERFFDNEPEGSFLPAIMTDRNIFVGFLDMGPAYFVSSGETLASMIEGSLMMPSFISVTPTCTVNDADNTVDIHVEGEATMREMPFQTDLRLNVYLVEDYVASNSVAGVKGTYYHQGVIRKKITDIEGEPLDIATLKYSRDYTANLDPAWNKSNMRVVAFVANRSDDPALNPVYNAKQVYLDPTSGIHSIEADPAKAGVHYDGSKFRAADGATVSAVYNAAGARLRNDHLATGFYIVKVEKDGATYLNKVMVD